MATIGADARSSSVAETDNPAPAARRIEALDFVRGVAVTNYLTHSMVCGIFFMGLGYYGQLERPQLYYLVFAIWLRHFRFGPVEWLWRSLTYMQRRPMRR